MVATVDLSNELVNRIVELCDASGMDWRENHADVDFTRDGDDRPFWIVDGWDSVGKLNRHIVTVCTEAGIDLELDDFPKDKYDERPLERVMGDQWGFSDEYTTCSNCYNAIRTEPDSMFWRPAYHLTHGAIYCKDCVDAEEYMIDHSKGELRRDPVNPYFVDPSEVEGWIEIDGYEIYDYDKHLKKLRRALPYIFIAYDTAGVYYTLWAKVDPELVEENDDYADPLIVQALVKSALDQLGIDTITPWNLRISEFRATLPMY